ncbi:MAG: extracellular solute-binding protein, partial [Treponema sp.]|nr:extracellular solute-binding protein [Treponema sp.]
LRAMFRALGRAWLGFWKRPLRAWRKGLDEAARRRAARREAAKLRTAKRDAARLQAIKRWAEKRDAFKLWAAKLAEARLEASKLRAAKREAARLQASKRKAERGQAFKLWAAKLVEARREASKLRAVKREEARLRAAKREEAGREAAKLRTAKREEARLRAIKRKAERGQAFKLWAAKREAARCEAFKLRAAKRDKARLQSIKRKAERREEFRLRASRRKAQKGRPIKRRKSVARPTNKIPELARARIGGRVDVFLAVSAVAVLIFIFAGQSRMAASQAAALLARNAAFNTIYVSPHFWAMFGDTAHVIVAEFEAQNPGTRVVMAGEDEKDIIFFDSGDFAGHIENAHLASLSPYIFTENEEDQWALPLVSFIDLFFYNIDILQMAGRDRPPSTRAEFLAAAQAVAQSESGLRGEVFPFALGLGDPDLVGVRRDFLPWVWALGAGVHSGFGADGALALTAQARGTVNFIGDLYKEGLLAPGSFEKTGRERLEQFAAGEIAMLIASARDILLVRDLAGEINFDVTAIPQATPGRHRLGISGIYAGISSDSARPDWAWDFLVFVSARSHVLSAAIGAVPGTFFVNFPSRQLEQDPLHAKAWDIFDAAEIVEFSSLAERDAASAIRLMLARAFGSE